MTTYVIAYRDEDSRKILSYYAGTDWSRIRGYDDEEWEGEVPTYTIDIDKAVHYPTRQTAREAIDTNKLDPFLFEVVAA